jgi:hypothetical protein
MAKPVKPQTTLDLNPTTGRIDVITDNNFSYQSVPENKRLKIPENMQMAHHGPFELEGALIIDGAMIVED